MKHVCALICFVLAATSLQQAQGRAARTLLQTASSEADAAAWVTANLTGPSPNVQAASTAVAQAASSARSSGSASSTALATAFVNVLSSGGDASVGNATATAFSQALSNTRGDAGSQQVIAQAYSTAVLSLYRDNQVQAASTAVAAALAAGQDSSVVAANAAAFASSNATVIAIAKIASITTPPQGVNVNCLSYSKAYADAVTSVITASPSQVSAAASAVAAAFAQGCSVERATGLALTEAIHTLGCQTVGPVLLTAQAYAASSANTFGSSASAFAAASARYSVVRQCLFDTTIASDATASASASAAATAIAQGDATAASNVITGALCNPVTATATAQAFAQAIATGQGCDGLIFQAISTAYASSTSTVTSCGASSAAASASASAAASLFFDYPPIASCRNGDPVVKPGSDSTTTNPPSPFPGMGPDMAPPPVPGMGPDMAPPPDPGPGPDTAPPGCPCPVMIPGQFPAAPICGTDGRTYYDPECARCANVKAAASGPCHYDITCTDSAPRVECPVNPCENCAYRPGALCIVNYCQGGANFNVYGRDRMGAESPGLNVSSGACSAVAVHSELGFAGAQTCMASGMAPQPNPLPLFPESAMAQTPQASA